MNKSREPTGDRHELPKARMASNWKTYVFWLIPIGAALLAGWFIYTNVFSGGATLHLFFSDSAGLEPGKSLVKYRGAEIGTVKDVQLTKDHQQVEITVTLKSFADSVARKGTRFWIVQAHVGLAQIQGLRTIVSGDYIEVDPGEGEPETRFEGLNEAPLVEPGGAIPLVLFAEKLGSTKRSSPVYFRGVQVGQVTETQLSTNAQIVQIAIHIQKRFAPLVRMNSRFWNAGGVNVSIGLNGADISAQSAQALLSGGIAFATPDTTEKEAPAGTSFRLYDKPEDAWLSWAPEIRLKSSQANPASAANENIP